MRADPAFALSTPGPEARPGSENSKVKSLFSKHSWARDEAKFSEFEGESHLFSEHSWVCVVGRKAPLKMGKVPPETSPTGGTLLPRPPSRGKVLPEIARSQAGL